MVIRLFPVVGEGDVEAVLLVQGHGNCRCQDDALVRRPEEAVELQARRHNRIGIEHAQVCERPTCGEQAAIEEIWRLPAGLELEVPEPEHLPGQRNLHEPVCDLGVCTSTLLTWLCRLCGHGSRRKPPSAWSE